jgi:hypothetical protein
LVFQKTSTITRLKATKLWFGLWLIARKSFWISKWDCPRMWMIPIICWGSFQVVSTCIAWGLLTWLLGHKMKCFHVYLMKKYIHCFLSSWPHIQKKGDNVQFWNYCTIANTKDAHILDPSTIYHQSFSFSLHASL